MGRKKDMDRLASLYDASMAAFNALPIVDTPRHHTEERTVEAVDVIKLDTDHGMRAPYIDSPDAVDVVGPYAWPGGYAVYYVTTDGAVICPTCAPEEFTERDATRLYLHHADDTDDAYNGTGIQCENCNGWIVDHDPEEYARNFDADGNDIR